MSGKLNIQLSVLDPTPAEIRDVPGPVVSVARLASPLRIEELVVTARLKSDDEITWIRLDSVVSLTVEVPEPDLALAEPLAELRPAVEAPEPELVFTEPRGNPTLCNDQTTSFY